MLTPDTTNKTYLLQIDGANCYTVGGGAITPGIWTWVDYYSGSSSTRVELPLSQGAHNLKLIGNAPGVRIDRIIAVSDLSCTPYSFGDECNVPDDTTPPSVTLTAPIEGATVSGTVALTATATDNTGVAKVEFYDNSSLIASDTTSPYQASWSSLPAPNGTHLITARAYDAAGNVSSDSNTVSVVNGDTQAPTVPSSLAATALSYQTIKLTWHASTDNTAVTGYTVIRDGVPVANLNPVTEYTDSDLFADTTYQYKVEAFDAAGNRSAASAAVSAKTQTAADTQPPSKPSGLTLTAASPTQVNLSWTPSIDNIGVVSYDIYRSTGSGTAQKIGTSITSSFGDSTVKPRTSYIYSVVARDAAGNVSSSSDKARIRTPALPKRTVQLSGVVVSETTKKPLGQARVLLTVGSNRHVYQTDRRGRYAINDLTPGQYNLTFSARGYTSTTVPVDLSSSVTMQDVKLRKK